MYLQWWFLTANKLGHFFKGVIGCPFYTSWLWFFGVLTKNILWLKFLNGSVKKTTSLPCQNQLCFQHAVLVHAALNANELCWPHPSLPWSDEQNIDMCRFPIQPLQIRWRISHLAFTIIINEYSKIYKRITCCCTQTVNALKDLQTVPKITDCLMRNLGICIYIYGAY